jgi:2-keto-4-pentenoate hydratase/2-oxohepta-3-ene-1,7-dioic acid hydratase in catechol pathway
MHMYRHIVDGRKLDLPIGKVVCVGRNYAAHARELNNPVPTAPVLFIKPSTSLSPMADPITIPSVHGECLIGSTLKNCDLKEAQNAILGVGLSLDLTLRELQQELKEKGLPWEKAKAFDGACPTSDFISIGQCGDLQTQQIMLNQNGEVRQNGSTSDMLMPIVDLLVYISQFFTLLPGDIVLTGTPAGVGPLQGGDRLALSLSDLLHFKTEVHTS